jgi:hypothetical protein
VTVDSRSKAPDTPNMPLTLGISAALAGDAPINVINAVRQARIGFIIFLLSIGNLLLDLFSLFRIKGVADAGQGSYARA